MIRGIGDFIVLDLFSNFKWVRSSGYLVELIFGLILAGLVAVLFSSLARHCFGKPSTGRRLCEGILQT